MPCQTEIRAEGPMAKELAEQADRILHSRVFGTSELLRNLLSFLIKRAINYPGEPPKEYDVGVHGLGKPVSFDPRMDSAVRVHAARLRSKLAEYYASEGTADPLTIEVPKGAYLVSWHHRHRPPATVPERTEAGAATHRIETVRRWRWFAAGSVAAVLAVCICLALLQAARPDVSSAVKAFWQPFSESDRMPLVVFSNPRLAGSSATELRYFREGIDSPSDANETYSGTGTVMAVHELTRLFSLLERPIHLKRAELLTWDEVQRTNVIFIGGPEANTRLRELPPLREFAFKSMHSEPHFGVGGIINLHPRKDERQIYLSSGRPYTSDYAVMAMAPGFNSQNRLLLLAGTNTYGAQAAAEFATRDDRVQELLARLGTGTSEPVPNFEALIEVQVSGGVPVQSKLIIVRKR